MNLISYKPRYTVGRLVPKPYPETLVMAKMFYQKENLLSTSNQVKNINKLIDITTEQKNRKTFKTNDNKNNLHNRIVGDKYYSKGKPFDLKNKSNRRYSCKYCSFTTLLQKEIWIHIRTHIPASKLLSCPHCPFVCAFKHHMQYHLNNHFGFKPFKCQICSYRCNNKSMLNSHLKSHSTESPYKCNQCVYTSKYKQALYIHCIRMRHVPDGDSDGRSEARRKNNVEKSLDEKNLLKNDINKSEMKPCDINEFFARIQPKTHLANKTVFDCLTNNKKFKFSHILPSNFSPYSHVFDNEPFKALKPFIFSKPPLYTNNKTIYPFNNNIEDVLKFSSNFYHEIKNKILEKGFRNQEDAPTIYNIPLDLRITSRSE